MAHKVLMPKWGLSMQEGLIGQWLKEEGDSVAEGEEIVEIETEKMTNVVEAPAPGILARIVHPAGATVPVTRVIAIIAAPGEDLSDLDDLDLAEGQAAAPAEKEAVTAAPPEEKAAAPGGKPDGPVRAMPIARRLAKENNLDLADIEGTGPNGAITRKDVEKAIAADGSAAQKKGPVRAMPIARRLAKENNLDLADIEGTGPNGAITRKDVEKAIKDKKPDIRPLQKVRFYSEGIKLDGLLYSPAQATAQDRCPGVVLCVGYTYLKTMVAPDLAKALTQAGCVALAFDYRGFGDSDGPRGRLIPTEQVNDIRAALTFLGDQPHVDPARLAVVGISLGASHAVTVGGTDQRVQSVVAIEPMGDGERWLRSLRRHTEWMDFETRLAEDRLKRVHTGQSEKVDPLEIVLPDPDSRAFLDNVAREFPQMQVELPLESAEAIIAYRPEQVAGQIAPRPLLIIHGQNDRLVPLDESRRLHARAGQNSRLDVIAGMDHFNWVMPGSEGFGEVSRRVVEFMRQTLPGL